MPGMVFILIKEVFQDSIFLVHFSGILVNFVVENYIQCCVIAKLLSLDCIFE